MSESPVVQIRVPADTLARIDDVRGDLTRSAWLLKVAGERLGGRAGSAARTTGTPQSLAAGVPSPGTACMAPGCWERDTARYGLRQIPLCPACAASLRGEEHIRPRSGAASRTSGARSA